MAKKKASAPKEEINEDAVVAPESDAPKADGKASKAVAVYTTAGKLVRVYSEDQHGDEYKKLADEFVSHNAGFQVKPYVAPPLPKPPKEDTNKVTVYHPSGDVVRVFSLDAHGEDYIAMAEGFAERYAKRGYRLGSLKDK
jgi:hypothetical protein